MFGSDVFPIEIVPFLGDEFVSFPGWFFFLTKFVPAIFFEVFPALADTPVVHRDPVGGQSSAGWQRSGAAVGWVGFGASTWRVIPVSKW